MKTLHLQAYKIVTMRNYVLLKASLGDVQEFVRITEPDMKEFLIAGKKWTWELTVCKKVMANSGKCGKCILICPRD